MKRKMDLVINVDNYCLIRNWLEERVRGYRINVEQWVVARFLELPQKPDRVAVSKLNTWVQNYLPRRIHRRMWIELLTRSK